MELNFKTYTGTKTIKAVPMEKTEAEKLLGKSITPVTPGAEGYLVEYPDGYRSGLQHRHLKPPIEYPKLMLTV